jgi:hypothetical protein
MEITTIKLYQDTKKELDSFREYKNESYDELIKKILYVVKNFKKKPELSTETLASIERARNRIKRGELIDEKNARKRLGL